MMDIEKAILDAFPVGSQFTMRDARAKVLGHKMGTGISSPLERLVKSGHLSREGRIYTRLAGPFDNPFDNTQAYREGWGLFQRDDGTEAIQRLDDPQAIDPTYPAEPVFDSDDAAVRYCRGRSRSGSQYHVEAIRRDQHGASVGQHEEGEVLQTREQMLRGLEAKQSHK